MRVVIDAHIPFIAEAVRTEWPDVQIFPMEPEKIDAAAVQDADVLIVRTRTRVNVSLLEGSHVRMVCTATIGYDHIDRAYCESHGIRWISCPGCNAQAVCDYITEAWDEYLSPSTIHLSPLTIGIIGVGHVGSLVAAHALGRGYQVLLNDPAKGYTDSLDTIAHKCDIITYHVPLDATTYHMCEEAFLRQCKPDALIINAARGGVVDEQALLRSGRPYILDTWENEPNIDKGVLAHAWRASMHIAGYSIAGKYRASKMCLDAIAQEFGLPKITRFTIPASEGDSDPGWLERISAQLKAHPEEFESLRKQYPLR